MYFYFEEIDRSVGFLSPFFRQFKMYYNLQRNGLRCGAYIQWNFILFKGIKQCQFHIEIIIQNEVSQKEKDKYHIRTIELSNPRVSLQTLKPLHDCSNEHHWRLHFSFLKSLLSWLQCTILVLIFPLDNSIVLMVLLLAHCILFPKPII